MRSGLFAFGAAMLCAAPAHAATFIVYEFGGTGIRQATNGAGIAIGDPQAIGFYGTFSLVTRPEYGDVQNVSTGNVFTHQYTDGTETFDGTTSGLLTGSNQILYPGGGISTSLRVNYADTDALGGLPEATAGTAATGSYSYFLRNPGGFGDNFYLSGAITSFRVLSTSASYRPLGLPSFSALPEPANWAMMIAGVGAIGATVRRRRRVAAIA